MNPAGSNAIIGWRMLIPPDVLGRAVTNLLRTIPPVLTLTLTLGVFAVPGDARAQTSSPHRAPALRDYDDVPVAASTRRAPRILRDYDDTAFVVLAPATHAVHDYDDLPDERGVTPAQPTPLTVYDEPVANPLPAVECSARAAVAPLEITAVAPASTAVAASNPPRTAAGPAVVIRAAPLVPVELPVVRVAP